MKMPRARRGNSPLLLLLLLLLSTTCNREDLSGRADEAMLLMLSEARALQRRADLHLLDGELAPAIADVREVLAIRFPPSSIEGEETLLDAHGRLARLLLSQGGEDSERQALVQIEAGRKLATRDSFFRAHLESVAAEIYEARAKRQSEPVAATESRKEALRALERAIAIDRHLQRVLLSLPALPEEH